MEFNDVISKRKSIRSYKSTPIPDEVITEILETARQAPSWMNKQCWHFIIVKQASIINEIAKTSLINRWMKQAPVVIIACADPHQSGHNNGIAYYTVDAAIAMQHIILAATNLELGTCWIAAFDEQQLKQILEVPPRIRIIGLTPLGYPKEKPSIASKTRTFLARSTKRKKLSEITHINTW